jgi:hypothetical protein
LREYGNWNDHRHHKLTDDLRELKSEIKWQNYNNS